MITNKKSDYESLLEEPDKGMRSSKGVITRLWRTLLFDLNINGNRWNTLMHRYINNPRNLKDRDNASKSWARGNLNTELTKDNMTYGNLENGIRFLGISKFKLILVAEWFTGHRTHHGVRANVDGSSEVTDLEYVEFLNDSIIIRNDEELIVELVEAYRNNPKRYEYILSQASERLSKETARD